MKDKKWDSRMVAKMVAKSVASSVDSLEVNLDPSKVGHLAEKMVVPWIVERVAV